MRAPRRRNANSAELGGAKPGQPPETGAALIAPSASAIEAGEQSRTVTLM
jgi:hypothetical protein